MRIWRRTEFDGAGAKHFRARLQLHMDFESNCCDVWNCRFQIEDFKFADAHLRDVTKITTSSLASFSNGSTLSGGSNFASVINSSHSCVSSASSRTTPILATNFVFERARQVAR